MNESSRPLAVFLAIAGVAMVFVGVIVVLAHPSTKRETPSPLVLRKQRSEVAQAAARQKTHHEQAVASGRIAALKMRCIKRYICHLALGGEQSLPLYIEGMDEHLVRYLVQHGYTDSWTDSDHIFNVQAIGPGDSDDGLVLRKYQNQIGEELKFTYLAGINVSGECECESAGADLMFENADIVGGHGLMPPMSSQPGSTFRWTVFWRLKDASGRVVRRLHFTITVANCEYSNAEDLTPCGRSIHARYEEGPKYPVPPLFPYTS